MPDAKNSFRELARRFRLFAEHPDKANPADIRNLATRAAKLSAGYARDGKTGFPFSFDLVFADVSLDEKARTWAQLWHIMVMALTVANRDGSQSPFTVGGAQFEVQQQGPSRALGYSRALDHADTDDNLDDDQISILDQTQVNQGAVWVTTGKLSLPPGQWLGRALDYAEACDALADLVGEPREPVDTKTKPDATCAGNRLGASKRRRRDRRIKAWRLHKQGHTNSEIAGHLGVHESTVSRYLKESEPQA